MAILTRNRLRRLATDVRRAVCPSPRDRELRRISRLPRYTAGTTNLFGGEFRFADAESFSSMYRSIVLGNLYRFPTSNPHPYILDCGANVGVASRYFATLYPQAEIVAFEPDARIHGFLTGNLLGLSGVKVVNAALGSHDGEVTFVSEGADAGFVAVDDNGAVGATVKVRMERLSSYLNRPVAFLKMDIEGGECDVLEECSEQLHFVERAFVEYHSYEGRPQRLGKVCTILERAGFRLIVKPSYAPMHPLQVVASSYGMDNRLDIFAVR